MTQSPAITPAHADSSKRLAKRLYHTLKYSKQQSMLILEQEEINGLTALLHRAVPSTKMAITLSEHGTVMLASILAPQPFSRFYLNISATLLPSKEGVELSTVRLGDINLNGETTLTLVSWLFNWYAGDGSADKLLASVNSVAMSPRRLMIALNVEQDLLALSNQSLFHKLRDDLALLGDASLVKFYYQSLVAFAQQQPIRLPLSAFIQHLFSHTYQQNQIKRPESYIAQNRAILVALSLYFTRDKLALLVGDVGTLSQSQRQKQHIHRAMVTLALRSDLQQHFMYSIALQLLSNVETSDALGEFKELLDTNQGGSGFSFADLMADRAGTRLAMMATYSETQAKEIQAVLAQIDDKSLLPSIEQLREGLDEQAFNQSFSNVASANYQQMIKLIDNRLKSLPLYQFYWR